MGISGKAGMKSCYQVLGLASPQVSEEQIDEAYRSLIVEHAGNSDYRKAVEAAYATLKDPERRAAHDKRLLAELSESRVAAPATTLGGGGLKWLGGLSMVVAVLGYHYSTRAQPELQQPTMQAATVLAPVAEERTIPDSASEARQQPASIPVDQDKGSDSTWAVQAPTAVEQRFVRPVKKNGFDADYLSWTVYLVVGGRGRGSGVMVAPGKVLTNCHVVAGNALSGLVVVNSATHEVARVDKYSKLEDDEDVCLLSAPGAPSHVAEWGRSESLDIGATTYTVSFPSNEGLTWSSGKLIRREYPLGMEVAMTSNYCRPGVSGGPLFDEKGLLVGITSAGRTYRGGGTECMSLTAETARKVLYKPMVPIALAPAQYDPAMLRR